LAILLAIPAATELGPMRQFKRHCLGLTALLLISALVGPAGGGSPEDLKIPNAVYCDNRGNKNTSPKQAVAVGYTMNVFSSRFNDTIDMSNSGAPGFQWYPFSFYGSKPNLKAIRPNADGSVTLLGDVTGPNGEIATGWAGPKGFVGTSFGGGGYFEAELSFNPQDAIKANFAGWPSFWALAREHIDNTGSTQWPGQIAGYDHYIEADFFEYNIYPYTKQLESYGSSLHDWSGVWTPARGYPTNISSDPLVAAPTGTVFTNYHKYGMLWIPATSTTQGYAKFYFDNVQVGGKTLNSSLPCRVMRRLRLAEFCSSALTWDLFTNQIPASFPPFAIMDKQHLVLILGTGVGIPMNVNSVNVWTK
jgi:hypothetical protein